MKSMKKLFAMMLSFALVFTLALPAFAADAKDGETYKAYKIFDATVTVGGSGEITHASYTIADDSQWLTEVQTYAGIAGKGLTLTQSANGTEYVVTFTEGTFSAADFAAAMAAHAENKTADAMRESSEATTTFTGVEDGYYLVTSSLGSLAALATYDGTITIVEKNTVPTIEKTVQEDSSNTYADNVSIDWKDDINYKLTVTNGNNGYDALGTGVDDNYVIVDTLPAGIDYKTGSIVVNTDWVVDTDYTVNYANKMLTITLLSTGKLKDTVEDQQIVITYTATVTNKDLVTVAGTGNVNNVELTYSGQIARSSAIVYIGQFGANNSFTKVDGTDKTTRLDGVEFVLSKNDNGVKYAVIADGWLDRWTDNEDDATALVTDTAGHIALQGLDAGTYTLTETLAKDGYNLLTDTITVVIDGTGSATYKYTTDTGNAANTITVENNMGTTLPSTGGMGTTLVYILGGILAVGSGILLVVRRRMSVER